MKKASILLIYTGGTIGMMKDPVDGTLKPYDFSVFMEEVPELRKFALKIDSYTFDPLIDSSDVEPSMWQALAELIRDRYDNYDGFVVLHGTDTMAYSASALSFMLDDLAKPVVFTGSQLPIGVPRTDGKENLISSIEIASAMDAEGHAIVPEVVIYFNSKLMRGNRTTKTSSENFDAFSSPNYPLLGEAGINIRFFPEYIRKPLSWVAPLRINTNLDTRVSILKLHPGMTADVLKHLLCGEETRAVIIETYGSGNAPTKPWFLNIICEAVAMGKIIVNVTQCLEGAVNMSLYEGGKAMQDAGVTSGYDGTTESTLAKLFFLLGLSKDNQAVRTRMEASLKGEISK